MTTPLATAEPFVPTDEVREYVREAQHVLESSGSHAELVGPDGTRTVLPDTLYRLLVQAARELEQGRAVTLVPATRNLTTQQAADLLGVSRPFLIQLLDRDELPHQMTGTHRRIPLAAVLEYRERRSAHRKRALGELVREAQAAGEYRT